RRVVGEMGEVAAHQPTRLVTVFGAALVVEIGHLLEPAVAHRGGKWRDDEAAVEPRGKLDRRFGKGSDIGRDRSLYRLRRNARIVEGVMPAVMRDAVLGCPQLAHHFEALVKDALVFRERDLERRVFARIVTAAGSEIY